MDIQWDHDHQLFVIVDSENNINVQFVSFLPDYTKTSVYLLMRLLNTVVVIADHARMDFVLN
jgi:hypothetical protein